MNPFPCPRCGQFLDVMESQLGKLAECPHCANRFQMPLVPPAPPPKGASGVRHSGATIASRKRPAPKAVDDLEEFTEEEERPKRRKKRRQMSTSGGIGGYTALMIAMAGICVVFTGVGVFIPMVMLVPTVIGFVIAFGAGLWLLAIPFRESAVQGLLCMFVPFYVFYYLLAHFDEMWKPFVLQLLGVAMFLGCFFLFLAMARIPLKPA